MLRPRLASDITSGSRPMLYLPVAPVGPLTACAAVSALRFRQLVSLRLAPTASLSGQVSNELPTCAGRPTFRLDWRPYFQLSSGTTLQLACNITPGLHRMLQALAPPRTQPTAHTVCCIHRLSWQPTSGFPRLPPSGLHQRPASDLHLSLSPSAVAPPGFRLAPGAR